MNEKSQSIEPATFLFLAQRFNQLRHRMSGKLVLHIIHMNSTDCIFLGDVERTMKRIGVCVHTMKTYRGVVV